MVVQLAVEDQHYRAVVRRHWLMTSCRKVDDAEPPMGERDTVRVVDELPVVVGSAMRDRVSHLRKLRQLGALSRHHLPSDYSAHAVLSLHTDRRPRRRFF